MEASQGTSAEERRRRELEEHQAAARRALATTQVHLAATEASRRELAEQVQKMAGQAHRQPSRWSWTSCGAGIALGAVALSPVLGTAASSQVRAAPPLVVLAIPAPAAAVVASRGADAEWRATRHELDATWEQDWPQTIAVPEAFLERWPGYSTAGAKLHAALLADAEANIEAEQVGAGVAELERAARLRPERGEAWARLAQLATVSQGDRI